MSNHEKPKPMIMRKDDPVRKGSKLTSLFAFSLIVAFIAILGHYFIQVERNQYNGKIIVLFDGVCTLCNGFVNFVIDHDSDKNIQFSTLQSPKGQEFLRKFEFSTTEFNSIIVIEGENVFTHSTAALRVLLKMDTPFCDLYGFIIVPSFIRDYVYNTVATWRYTIFGKEEFCRAPTPELMDRFLDDKC